MKEVPVIFNCQQEHLFGIVHKSAGTTSMGVLIVVGGPQYRVGSHRQFVLLARKLCGEGFPVMRFDYRGMGDASGEITSFASVDEDIRVAINKFYETCPELDGVVIWGLCDAASAALFYAYQDPRVCGLVLLNPWVFTEQGAAKTYLKYYYLQRILSVELWKKIMTLQFDYKDSLYSLTSFMSKIFLSETNQKVEEPSASVDLVASSLPLPERMRECFKRFAGPVLLVLSGRDLTADEFREAVKSDEQWRQLLDDKRVTNVELKDADHTFSSAAWRAEVEEQTLAWLKLANLPKS